MKCDLLVDHLSSLLSLLSGTESVSVPGTRLPAEQRQEKPAGHSAGDWTEREDCETGSGPFGEVLPLQPICFEPCHRVSVAVDLHVRLHNTSDFYLLFHRIPA